VDLARRIAFNHATFGWDLPFPEFLSVVTNVGAGGVGVWSEHLGGLSPEVAGARIRDAGLAVTALNRGGFFVGATKADRQKSIDLTRMQIEFTARLGADVLLIVPGGLSTDVRDLSQARGHVAEGLEAVLPYAASAGIKLALEPFHPALTVARGVVNTLSSALDLCDLFGPCLGVITDIYHVWWDPEVYAAIARAGSRILGHHLCDSKLDASDPMMDRGVMGDGVADVAGLTRAVRQAGYSGLFEIEIFSRDDLWRRPAPEVAKLCLDRAVRCLSESDRESPCA